MWHPIVSALSRRRPRSFCQGACKLRAAARRPGTTVQYGTRLSARSAGRSRSPGGGDLLAAT
eukprot:562424-Hanusia_phi.AAC.1